MTDRCEVNELIKSSIKYGFDETIFEFFGEEMGRTAYTPIEIDLPIGTIVGLLRKEGADNAKILEYLQELKECEENELYAEYQEYTPFGLYTAIEFSDGLCIEF
jgi:hypothetical protein